MEKKHIVIFLVFVFFQITETAVHGRRNRLRSYYSSEELEQGIQNRIPPCDLLCQAQWKSDFQVTFQKIFESSYFESPLDPIVLSSKTSLNSFCSITHQKFRCLKKECGIKRVEWTPDKFICVDHLKDFQDNNRCLSRTSSVVRRECSDVCDNMPSSLSTSEKHYLEKLEMNRTMHLSYLNQNRICHVVSCHQICHEQVISHVCDEADRDKARQLVKEYYDSIFIREWKIREESNSNLLYSSYCRRVTPDLDENEHVTNMTIFNNAILERIKSGIKLMLLDLS